MWWIPLRFAIIINDKSVKILDLPTLTINIKLLVDSNSNSVLVLCEAKIADLSHKTQVP